MIEPFAPILRFELAPFVEDAEEAVMIREENEIEEPESRRLGQNVLGSDVRYKSQRIYLFGRVHERFS